MLRTRNKLSAIGSQLSAGALKGAPEVLVVGSRKGVNELNFQVKGQEYFLGFVESEGRWYLFAPSEQGVDRFPVYVDAPKYDRFAIIEKMSGNLTS